MDYLPLPDNAARQAIDSSTIFEEYRRVFAEARAYRGGMYGKVQGQYEYLAKTSPENKQTYIGKRTPETEAIYAAFTARKAEVEKRLKSIQEALREAERLNKALKVGRVPTIVVGLLQAFEDAGLSDHFIVVGTHALYAYETAAGVRIVQAALATNDVDLLWDARKKVRFLTDIERLDSSVLRILQKVDASFQRKTDQYETAINDKGFEVDFLRRQPVDEDPHPFRFSKDENNLWPVQARRADILTVTPKFEHIVVSTTGRMALMRTLDPQVFVDFKKWLAADAPGREPIKRRRDARQAQIVQALLADGLLLSPASGKQQG